MRTSIARKTAARLGPVLRYSAAAWVVAACCAGSPALANPTNPTVVNGSATFATTGNILNVTNSANTVINWGSFSINTNELTRFTQPSSASAVLNRVVGQDPSAILGALQSNGRVFVINPNGITFGAGAMIDVAGLVASTLNLSNEDFLANRMRFTDGAGAGDIVNQGSITGNAVYLVGRNVTNTGVITSPNGEVILAAGNSVELVSPGTPDLRVEITAPDNAARNLGAVVASAGRIGIYAGLINNSGTLNASSAVAEGGRILLKSTQATTLEATSALSARGTNGGTITVLSDKATGTTNVAGTLDASAAGPGAGHGGFVETSAANVRIGQSTQVDTMGVNGGASGLWLIDPTDFTITAGTATQTTSGIGATTLGNNLLFGPIVISTATAGTESGDIVVDGQLIYSSPNALTMTAHGNVVVNLNGAILNDGGGSLSLNAGWDGVSNAVTPILTNTGTVQIDAAISVLGDINLSAGDAINVNQAVSTAGNITLRAGVGDLTITARSLDSTGGNIRLSGNNIVIGSSNGSTSVTAAGLLSIVTPGSLTVQAGNGITTVVGNTNTTVDVGGNVNIQTAAGVAENTAILQGGPDITLTVGGTINIDDGSGVANIAQIVSTSPNTIRVDFPNISSGGFFVNGVENVVSAGTTGFFAGGVPAVLGTNLLFTYAAQGGAGGGAGGGTGGGSVGSISLPTQDLLVAMADSIPLRGVDKTSGILTLADDAKRPVCN